MKEPWDTREDPLEALRKGDPGPFEAFVHAETATFLGFFRRLGAGPVEAEDLVQETLLKLFRFADTYQRQGRFEAFAFRVARNAWIDRARRRAARPSGATGRVGDDSVDPLETRVQERFEAPDAVAERGELGERLQGALEQLGDAHRLVFELGVVQELPYQEVAGILDIPVGTVKSRMFHAVRKLRDLLEPADATRPEGGRA